MSDGTLHSDPAKKASLLNNQFTSVFTAEDVDNTPDLGPSPHPEVPHFNIGSTGVQKLLENIKPHKATGPDDIPARLLKEGARELAPALSLLFQATIQQGRIPHDWESAHVVPIFKKGDRHSPGTLPTSRGCCYASAPLASALDSGKLSG